MNSNKKNLIGAFILKISLVIIGISGSYAYFVNTIENVADRDNSVSITSGELKMNFTTSQYINASDGTLINDADLLTSSNAKYTSFSVALPNDAKVSRASYNLYLTDITISDSFKSPYVKWALYADGDVKKNEGTFENYTSGNIELLSSQDIEKNGPINYKLYIWLSNDDTVNQSSLLGGSIQAKVGFKAVTK